MTDPDKMRDGASRHRPPGDDRGAMPVPAGERTIDRDRLVWDPDYRREISRQLRTPPPAPLPGEEERPE